MTNRPGKFVHPRLAVWLALASGLCGCAPTAGVWKEPEIAPPRMVAASTKKNLDAPDRDGDITIQPVTWENEIGQALPEQSRNARQQAEQAYRIACERLDEPTDELVELFLQSSIAAWRANELCENNESEETCQRVADLYHSSLVKFIQFVEEYGRRDPRRGIRVTMGGLEQWIPIHYHGFAWKPESFDDLLVIGSTNDSELGEHHRRPGWGVPLVGLRLDHRQRFECRNTAFPATCILRVETPPAADHATPESISLEMYEPRDYSWWIDSHGRQQPLAADFTAPLTWYLHHKSADRLHGFRDPDNDDARLVMLEPYQPGKIPVVLVHGLLSDPTTWLHLINDLYRDPEFFQHYQLLVFQYPTGKEFLSSAAEFRRELSVLFADLWETHRDPSLFHAVLIGHSMGGLLSRFQVTGSQDELWQAFSGADLAEVRLGTSFRKKVRHVFFFEPVPWVERVVFIGTPHNGSRIARHVIGRLASNLVVRQFQGEYQQIIRKNPGVFNKDYEQRLPTSTELLIPDNPVLATLNRLETAPRVHLHSIIGTGKYMIGQGQADGVVPVASARIPGVDSEILVDAKHSEIQHHHETVVEINRILKLHRESVNRQKDPLAARPESTEDSAEPESTTVLR